MNKNFLTSINNIKSKYPNALVMFRIDEDYHMINDDAVNFAKQTGKKIEPLEIEDITIDHIKFPFHSLDCFLPKMIKAGFRIAIADQLKNPKK